jgi:hypothetical protein
MVPKRPRVAAASTVGMMSWSVGAEDAGIEGVV